MVSRWLKPCFYIAVHSPLMLALPFTAAPVKDVKDAQAYNDLTKDEAVWFMHRKGGTDALGAAFLSVAQEHQHVLTFGEAPASLSTS